MVFNPQLNVRDPKDFLNMSRGVEVDTTGDTSLGTTLKQAGDLISVGTKAVNSMFESIITEKMEPQVDQARSEMGVDAATTIQGAPGTTTPQEISRAFTELEGMSKAVAQGTMKDSHYWGRLNAVAKQLRSKYAGHRDFIDQKMASMVGTNPANALIRSLQSEAMEAQRKANSQADKEQAYVLAASKSGNVSPALIEGYQNGFIPFNEFVLSVTRNTYAQDQIKAQQQALNLRKAQGEAVDKDTEDFWERSSATRTDAEFNDRMTALGGAYANVRDRMVSMSQGRIQTPEEKQGLSNAFIQLELEIENSLNKHANQSWGGDDARSFAQRLPQERIRKTIEMHKGRIKAMRDAAEKGDLSLLGQTKLVLEAAQTNNKIEAIKDKTLANINTMRDLVGENTIALAMAQNPKLISTTKQAITSFIVSNSVATGQPLSSVIKEAQAAGSDAVTEREANLMIGKILADPKTTLQGARNVVQSFFGENNKDYLRMQPASERARTLSELTTPAAEARLWELRQSGDPNLWTQYKTWVNHNVVSHATPTINALASYMSTENRKTNITFDGTRFVVTGVQGADAFTSGATRPSVSGELAYSGEVVRAQNIVRDLNSFFRPLHGIATREGRDPQQEAFNLVNMVGLGNQIVPMANVTTKGDSGDGGGDGDRQTLEPETGGEGADAEIKRRMEEEEKGAGIPGSPPDFTMLSQELRIPEDIMRDVSERDSEVIAQFWKKYIDYRKKQFPMTPKK